MRVIGGADDGLIANIASAHNIKVKSTDPSEAVTQWEIRFESAIMGGVYGSCVGMLTSMMIGEKHLVTILFFGVIGIVVGAFLTRIK